MKYFSRDDVNPGRQTEVDCLKAFTIFLMLIVHVYENCADSLDNVVFQAFHLYDGQLCGRSAAGLLYRDGRGGLFPAVLLLCVCGVRLCSGRRVSAHN